MDNFYPKSWRGWVIALVAMACAFWIYYGFWYDNILETYQDTFLDSVSSASVQKEGEQFDFSLQRPKYIAFSDFVERECVVRIENRGTTPLQFTLTVRGEVMDAQGVKSNDHVRIRSEDALERKEYASAFAVNVAPQSIQEIPLTVSLEKIDPGTAPTAHLVFYRDGNEIDLGNGDALDFKYSPIDAFKEWTIKYLLFPPFSNIFLAIAVLFVVRGVEECKNSLLFIFLSQIGIGKNRSASSQPSPKGSGAGKKIFDVLLKVDTQKFWKDIREILAWLFCSTLLFWTGVEFLWNLFLWKNGWTTFIFAILVLVVLLGLLARVREGSLGVAVISYMDDTDFTDSHGKSVSSQ